MIIDKAIVFPEGPLGEPVGHSLGCHYRLSDLFFVAQAIAYEMSVVDYHFYRRLVHEIPSDLSLIQILRRPIHPVKG